jgi:hypothetical protein
MHLPYSVTLQPSKRPVYRDGGRHAGFVFCVSETEAAAIRAVFFEEGELTATIDLRRMFPGITDNVQARLHARVIAGWEPSPPNPAAGAVLQLRRRRQQ